MILFRKIRRTRAASRRLALALAVLAVSAGAGCNAPPTPEEIQQGRTLYRAHGCAVCHGENGHGDGVSAPNLLIVPRDFRNLAGYAQGTSPDRIADAIAQGSPVPGSPMAGFPHIPEKERMLIAHYIASLQERGAR